MNLADLPHAVAPDQAAALRPRLTQANADLTREVTVVDESGQPRAIRIPAERDLTVYVDKRELVTLMTLGANPEWLVLGYLLNQRLVGGVHDIESITVDWDVGAAAVVTRAGIDRIEERTARRVVTTGCGQGSVFGGLMDDVDRIVLPPQATLRQSQLYDIVNTIRLHDSTYKTAGSVHACALFVNEDLQLFVEDVGRHNAVDTIAGWMALQQPLPAGEKVFYTTGRLTSEMVIKSAQMGVPVVVSRSGITEMGLHVAQRVGLCAVGRATHRRFLCFSHPQRIVFDDMPPPAA
ncbi:formate dehydrogenase accessory sulfurtransferase FdhD [Hydrogenophaga sp. H7]|uniref:formate dehydrogenase accessory sulfurtransferase FdhD n=1 Tax=Hydrogenophaga sp. H7 TaxID=1882399 RepID=UPI0009A44F77|nr:formate dehydrogenase accessory sulfurtransferase FdhD [Hydrogenophaga sp. H7]OPF62199.1 formate dehydrogenase family accessory protein FdhD [Hydrogenophaga sp. H7]